MMSREGRETKAEAKASEAEAEVARARGKTVRQRRQPHDLPHSPRDGTFRLTDHVIVLLTAHVPVSIHPQGKAIQE